MTYLDDAIYAVTHIISEKDDFVDFVDFDKIDRIEVDFVASVYAALGGSFTGQ